MTVNDPHSYARAAEAVVTHLNLKLEVDFETKTIRGIAMMNVKVAEGVDSISLDTRDLTIHKAEADGKEVKFSLGSPDQFLGSELKIPVTTSTKTITVHYTTSPSAAALQWLNPDQTADKKSPFLFTQSQAILARTWVPIQDSPGIRFTYEAEVTVPKGMLAVMSAENPVSKSEDGKYRMKMPQPVPAYLLALAAGDFAFKPIDNRTGVYAEHSVLDKAVNEFADLPKMMSAAEQLYGPYEWGRYDLIVLPPSFPFGGMENPRITFATPTILAGDRSLTALVAHELAHSWSGNLVTNATWDDFWMNEGFTVYFENRIMEALYGKDFADMQALLGVEDLHETMQELGPESELTHLKLNLAGRDPDDGMNDVAYEKGRLLLLLIERTVGREKLDKFLRDYFRRHAFKTITTEQFIEEYQSEIIGRDSAAAEKININEWVYRPGLPSNAPVIRSERFEAVAQEVSHWKTGTPAKELKTSGYTTNEWLRFLRSLPDTMTHEQMRELDDAFGFSKTGNSEIHFAWLDHVIRNEYRENYPQVREFLMTVGRRKFVKPLFAAMMKTESGRQLAEEIYRDSRQNYHSVTQNTIDAMLKK